MKIVKAGHEILTPLNGMEILKHIERCGRVCYKSEEKITDDSCVQFVKSILKRGHESVIEHFSFTVRFICDRGVSHEIVRHRLASYSQESTRYCNYGNADDGCTFIIPMWMNLPEGHIENIAGDWYSENRRSELMYDASEDIWLTAIWDADRAYMEALNKGWTPQQARSVLPNSLKTEVVMTANLREWRHFFKLRTAKAAHPQMREVAIPLLEEVKALIPVIFDDVVGGGYS